LPSFLFSACSQPIELLFFVKEEASYSLPSAQPFQDDEYKILGY